MAPRAEKPAKQAPAGTKIHIKRHIQALGLKNQNEYRHWRIDHGFPAELDEKQKDLNRELVAFGTEGKHQHALQRIIAI